MRTLLLIDANSLVHRAYHALPTLTARNGRDMQAVYGVASILLKLWRESRPDYAAALFDRPEPTVRKKKYRGYKAQRPPTPDDLVAQLIESRELFARFSIAVFEKVGWEADDLIASAAERFKKDARVVILSGDLDVLQLVEDERVVARVFKKGISESVRYDEEAVCERYHLSPHQLIDYKALVGDPSDNIKGVPGVGPKTATELLERFGSIEGIYTHLDEDEKLKRKLGPFRKEAAFSKELVTLNREVPLGAQDITTLTVLDTTTPLKKYFSSLGFPSLVQRLEKPPEHTTRQQSLL